VSGSRIPTPKLHDAECPKYSLFYEEKRMCLKLKAGTFQPNFSSRHCRQYQGSIKALPCPHFRQ